MTFVVLITLIVTGVPAINELQHEVTVDLGEFDVFFSFSVEHFFLPCREIVSKRMKSEMFSLK